MSIQTLSNLHQPSNIDYTNASIIGNGWIEESWNVEVWVINNNSNGVPSAAVTLEFDQLESTIGDSTNDLALFSSQISVERGTTVLVKPIYICDNQLRL